MICPICKKEREQGETTIRKVRLCIDCEKDYQTFMDVKLPELQTQWIVLRKKQFELPLGVKPCPNCGASESFIIE